METDALSIGSCVMEPRDDGSTYVTQDGQKGCYRYKKSENTEFSVVWDYASGSRAELMGTQVCLIESEKNILWTEVFRRIDKIEVSNDGTVVVKDISRSSWTNPKDIVVPVYLNSLHVISKVGQRLDLDFGEQAHVISFGLSPDGNFLAYNLQKYHPDIYEIILLNLRENKEEWRYKYPQNQVVHELIFKGPRLLVYAGPRPSRYVDRRYSFTLDLRGKLVENDTVESQKQKESDDVQDRIMQIFASNLVDVAPTVEVRRGARSQAERKTATSTLVNIMEGQRPLPALYADISPGGRQSRFLLNITAFARTPEERVKTVEKCLVMLAKKKEEFRKNNLSILNIPQPRNVPSFPGSGPYFRSQITAIVAYPSAASIDSQANPEDSLLHVSQTWDETGGHIRINVDKAALEDISKGPKKKKGSRKSGLSKGR